MATKMFCDVCGEEMEGDEAYVELKFLDESPGPDVEMPEYIYLDVHFAHVKSLAKRLEAAIREPKKK